MAHDLATTSDGRKMMAYFGETPWHGLGQVLENPATAAEAMVAAGLDWTVTPRTVATCDGTDLPSTRAIRRDDTGEILGVVSAAYKPIQNSEAFTFLDGIAAEKQIRYHTAGGLGKGERIWLLAKLDGIIRVGKTDDITEKYLLLSNNHDGKNALRCFFTPIRVVCQNTLTLAQGKAKGEGVSIRHTGEIDLKLAESRRILGLADRAFDSFADQVDLMSRTRLTDRQVRAYFETIYPKPENPDEAPRAKANYDTAMSRLQSLYHGGGMGADMPAIRGTLWAAYNAVTESIDHQHRAALAELRDPSNPLSNLPVQFAAGAATRLNSIWFGTGASKKAEALVSAVAIAKDLN